MSGYKPKGKHAEKRLSAAFVRTVSAPGMHGDGNGLYLKVERSGAKRWVQRLIVHGRRRDLGLGSASLISLAEARERALEHRKEARAGNDPLAAKRRSQGILTLQEAAERYQEIAKPHWRSEKHAKQWLKTLATHVFPKLGARRVDTLDSGDILVVLSPIWASHPETARRVKQRLGTVLDWAIAKGWRADNPAKSVAFALPKHDRSKVEHRKALPYGDVAGAIRRVRMSAAGLSTKLAFEYLVLTATRSKETREARWSEIDLKQRVWIIPGERMKAKKEHRVPLSDRCLEILSDAVQLSPCDPRGARSGLIFPSAKPGKPMSDNTLSKLLRELSIDAVPHGFRSSFRVWAAEQTNHPREVIEFALAHLIKDKAEAAYARSDLFQKRKNLMDDWDSYLDGERG